MTSEMNSTTRITNSDSITSSKSNSTDCLSPLPRMINTKPYFENARHSWVFTKAPPAPEALTSVPTTFYSSSFDLPSDPPSPNQSHDSLITSLSNQRGTTANLTDSQTKEEPVRPRRTAPSGLRTYTIPPSPGSTPSQPIESLSTTNPSTNNSKPVEANDKPSLPPNLVLLNSQRTSIASSNRDSIGSDMGYFSTSPGSEVGGKNLLTTQNLTNLARLSFGPSEAANLARLQEFNHYLPSLTQAVATQTQSPDMVPYSTTEDGVGVGGGNHTARSSLYLTPLSFSPSISYSDLPRSVVQPLTLDLVDPDMKPTSKPSGQPSSSQPTSQRNESPSPLSTRAALDQSSPNLNPTSLPPNKDVSSRRRPQPSSNVKRDSGVGGDPSPTEKSPPNQDSDLATNSIQETGTTPDPATSYPPHIQRRLNIALEILQTERTYVAGLELIEKVFYRPLMEASQTTSPILDSKRISDIFSNLMGILTVNREFLSQLERRLQDPRAPWSPVTDLIGDIFCQMAPYFRMYSLYVKNFNSALSVISDQMGKTSAFASFLKARSVTEQCKGLPFESYLILPVQRIPRYKLLIEDLLKRTDPTHRDHQNLVEGLDIVQRVATFVNETIRQHEMFMEMLKIQNSLVGFNEVLLVPGRRLIKRGSVHKICRKNHQLREFFLFTDLLVYASGGPSPDAPLNFHRKVLLELSKVVDVPDTDLIKNSFQIINPEKSFAVYCNSPTDKKAWIDAIRITIDDLLSSKRTLRLAAAAPPRRAAEVVLPQVITNYQAPVWIPDDQAENCHTCKEEFTVFRRKHHCRLCGNVVCHACSANTFYIPGSTLADLRPARACDGCYRAKFPGAAINSSLAPSRASFLSTDSSSLSSGTTLPRFPFNAPRRLAELRDSFVSRDSICSDSFLGDEGSRSSRYPDDSNSTTSTFTRLQRLRSMSGSTAALVAGLQSNAKTCQLCLIDFTVFKWKNECRVCRKIVCSDCLSKKPRSKRDSLWLAPVTPSSTVASVVIADEVDPHHLEEEGGVLCDPCYLGVDPSCVQVNPQGGGWGVHEATATASATPSHDPINESHKGSEMTPLENTSLTVVPHLAQ